MTQFKEQPTSDELLILRAFQRQVDRLRESSIVRQGKVTFKSTNSIDLATGEWKKSFEGFDKERFHAILPLLRQFLLNDQISFNRVHNIIYRCCGRVEILDWTKYLRRSWSRVLNQLPSKLESRLSGRSFTVEEAINRVFYGYGGLFHVDIQEPDENATIQAIEQGMLEKGFLDLLECLSDLDTMIYFWLDAPNEIVPPTPQVT